jgi:hypothetical protein
MDCVMCDGTGVAIPHLPFNCFYCGGTGKQWKEAV